MEEKYLNIKIKLKRNNEFKLIEYKYKKRTHDERPMALDVLLQAQEEQYDDLAFRYGCRARNCGVCTIDVNSRPKLACRARVREGDILSAIVTLPVIKDLVIDRSAFDRIQHSGGYISVNTSGNTQDANSIPINKEDADNAFDAATCIGCGACVATCKNSSAMLFVGAKISQYSLLPQGKTEASRRVLNMVNQMDLEGFGNCSNTGACEVECPKGISLDNIARMNRELLKASLKK